VCTRILKLKGDRGQALVELAFVLPLVLLLLFGIIDFGLAYNTKNSDTNLANLAARAVSVMGTTTTSQMCGATPEPSLTAWIDCVAAQDSEPVPATVCVWDSSHGAYAAGDALEVEINTSFKWFGVLGENGGFGSTIGASATNRIEASMVSGSTTNPFVTAAGGTTQCSS
jgi:Flp pilus assembly protein TadG